MIVHPMGRAALRVGRGARYHGPLRALPPPLLTSLQPEASSAGPVVRAVRLVEPPVGSLAAGPPAIVLDGRLEEAAWAFAPPAKASSSASPSRARTRPTTPRCGSSSIASTLYLGILARDPEPERVIARHPRARSPARDGRGALSLRGRRRHRAAPRSLPRPSQRLRVRDERERSGVRCPHLRRERALQRRLAGVWRVAAQRVREGWSAEFAIPFRSLRYPELGRSLGLQRLPGPAAQERGVAAGRAGRGRTAAFTA